MQLQITARQFTASDQLQNYVRRKIEKLERYYDGITDVRVILSKNGTPEAHVVEMSANVLKQQLVANASGSTHEEAVDECSDRLKRQVKRYKDKLRDTKKDEHR